MCSSVVAAYKRQLVESDFQRKPLIYAVEALDIYFQADGSLSLPSRVLELDLRLEEGGLRFYDSATGEKLLSHREAEQARRAAEARIAELEARLRALRPNHPPEDPPA